MIVKFIKIIVKKIFKKMKVISAKIVDLVIIIILIIPKKKTNLLKNI